MNFVNKSHRSRRDLRSSFAAMEVAHNRRPYHASDSFDSRFDSYAQLIAETRATTKAPKEKEPEEFIQCMAQLFNGLPDYSNYAFCKAHFGVEAQKRKNKPTLNELLMIYGRSPVQTPDMVDIDMH